MIVKMNLLYRYCHHNRNNGLIQSPLKSMSPGLYYSDFKDFLLSLYESMTFLLLTVLLCSHNLAFCLLFARVKVLIPNKAQQDTKRLTGKFPIPIVIFLIFFVCGNKSHLKPSEQSVIHIQFINQSLGKFGIWLASRYNGSLYHRTLLGRTRPLPSISWIVCFLNLEQYGISLSENISSKSNAFWFTVLGFFLVNHLSNINVIFTSSCRKNLPSGLYHVQN